jgi:parvulin-like peptidyl-prolyl isomerase
MHVVSTKPFTRVTGVPELAQAPEAVGAAYMLPLHAVSEPIRSTGGVVVERVDNRIPARRAVFDAQLEAQRAQALQQLRQERVREFLANLKAVAKVDDKRKQVEASARRTTQ